MYKFVFDEILFKKKLAFTLAEVLITLSVIGLLCSLTIPNLYQKHREKVIVSKVQKFYSTLNNAYNYAILKKGSAKYWNTGIWTESSANEIFELLFKSYYKIDKNCGTTNTGSCMSNDKYLSFQGGKHLDYGNRNGYYKIILKDGSLVFFRGKDPSDPTEHLGVYYDVNGVRGPNQVGTDLFLFIGKDNHIEPEGLSTFDSKCSKKSGFNCTAWVVYKENLDYLRCDDLQWNGKQKCLN